MMWFMLLDSFLGLIQEELRNTHLRFLQTAKAAVEATAGNNNIGSYLYFRMVSGAPISSYSKYYIWEIMSSINCN